MEWHSPDASLPSAEELAAYVGPKAHVYRSRFERFSRHGAIRFEFSWNWPAFFAGGWWYLYRKMYWWMAIDLGVSVLLGWTVFVPILWAAARAVTGNYLYFRQADRKIRDARPPHAAAPPAGDAAHLARLARDGGVHAWVPWVAIAAFLLMALLFAFLFGTAWVSIPPLRDIWPRGPGRWT